MGGADNPHRFDGGGGEPFRITGSSSPSQGALLAAQTTPGTTPQHNLGVSFQKTAAAVPSPKTKKGGSRGQLNKRKPGLPLQRNQGARSSSRGSGQAAKSRLLFGADGG